MDQPHISFPSTGVEAESPEDFFNAALGTIKEKHKRVQRLVHIIQLIKSPKIFEKEKFWHANTQILPPDLSPISETEFEARAACRLDRLGKPAKT